MGTFHLLSLSSFSFLSLSSSLLFRANLPTDTTSHPEYATIAMRNHSRPALKLNNFVFPLLDPNALTSFLDKPASFSKQSIKPAMGSSEDGILKRWLSRKTPDGLLFPSLSTTIIIDAPRPPCPTLLRTHERKAPPPIPVSPLKGLRASDPCSLCPRPFSLALGHLPLTSVLKNWNKPVTSAGEAALDGQLKDTSETVDVCGSSRMLSSGFVRI
ncbi:hypothetical protein K443DRAFT_14341 [Laccaria amethystina LaAM-08-1]|uniref:Unplaced genomic scaffold K443scaffold_463, whole genome shotgun sequence n=1 Tax=Laccaria amethystina LaAM-08-1 TaxID=1095629 RepID=A0A0C9WHN5_9AGAR|nr:hypothetical protein K443DRAFT_14341 [Laccaria amethystina LaAM-08-1]